MMRVDIYVDSFSLDESLQLLTFYIDFEASIAEQRAQLVLGAFTGLLKFWRYINVMINSFASLCESN